MDYQYKKLFSVDFLHSYHQSKKYEGFEIVPDQRTKQLIRSYGLVLKPINAGFIVFFREAESQPNLLKTISQTLKLTFYLTSKDGLLINYSDLIPDSVTKLYHLSNIDDSGVHRIQLHPEDFATENDRIQSISSLNGLLKLSKEIPETLKIENRNGELIFDGVWGDLQTQIGVEELFEHGYLSVSFDNEIPQPVYFVAPLNSSVFSVVDLYVNPEQGNASFNEVLGTSYTFSLQSRSVIWRYNLISRETQTYSDFKIIDGRNEVPTTEAKEITLSDGSSAYQIESKNAIALKERYEKHFELEMIKDSTAAINESIKKRMVLPAPDVNRIKVSKDNDTYNAYSEMYIYF